MASSDGLGGKKTNQTRHFKGHCCSPSITLSLLITFKLTQNSFFVSQNAFLFKAATRRLGLMVLMHMTL